MASYSSVSNEDKNNNRSDPSRMNNIDQTRLARLRPEKLDDAAVKEQISLIQQACGDVNQDIIAIVFHECDYDMQNTISRIRAGDFEDGGWQTAKSNNKKKNHNNLGEQILNGGTLSDSERSLSQRTSPTSSLRGGHHYQSSRTNTGRRGNNFISSNPRYPPRDNPTKKSVSSPKAAVTSEQIPSEIISPPKQSNEDIQQITSPSIDEYEFVDGTTQSLRFDNSQKKLLVPNVQTHLSKRRIPSLIPQVPVSMHPTVQFPTKPIDIQFGDVQWNDSVPMAVSPSNVSVNHEQETSVFGNSQNQDVQNTLSTNYIDHQITNELDIQLLETTNRLSSSSLSNVDNTIPNNLSIVPPEGTSHLSDHLTDTSSPIPTQYPSEQQAPLQMSTTRLPPTSTPRAPEYSSPTSQILPSHLQQSNHNATSSAFTPFNTLDNYQSIPRDYSHPTSSWNPQSTKYKTTPKGTMIQTGNYQQQQQPTYHLPPQQQQQQQQQLFFRPYGYPSLSPAVFQVLAPIEHWQTPVEPYTYPTTNYVSTYPNQQQYHPTTKYDRFYDKEFLGHYGQTRASNNDLSYQQQTSTTLQQGQQTKDTHVTSKLSPNAATFSQGVPLTASASATALYLNPVTFQMPTYFPSVAGSTHQDRILTYPSVDNHDNRNGASYSSTNNRNNYYHHGQQPQQQQQQRTHNINASNSSWHVQQ